MIANLLKREPATTVSPSGQASGESADHEALLASLKDDGLMLGHGGARGFGWFEVNEGQA